MKYVLLILATCIWPSITTAQTCPDYFRFVDLGITDANGLSQRGGRIFRISQDGTSLIQSEGTACREVGPVFIDGHAQPMPVVSRFFYDPSLLSPTLVEFSIMPADTNTNPALTPRENATAIATGADFRCFSSGSATITCQVANPYDAAVPFVINCSTTQCNLPQSNADGVMAISATWALDAGTASSPSNIGRTASAMITRIAAFLDPLMSG